MSAEDIETIDKLRRDLATANQDARQLWHLYAMADAKSRALLREYLRMRTLADMDREGVC